MRRSRGRACETVGRSGRFRCASVACRRPPGGSPGRWRCSSARAAPRGAPGRARGRRGRRGGGLLAAAGILEPGRPLAFVHPLVRAGVYSELSGAERSQRHRRAAELMAERPGATSAWPSTCWPPSPPATRWSVGGWSTPRARRAAGRARVGGRLPAPRAGRAAARRATRAAAARARHGRGDRGARRGRGPPAGGAGRRRRRRGAAGAALVLAHALGRAQRFGEAVEVLDRAASPLEPADGRARAARSLPPSRRRCSTPATAPSVADRREACASCPRGPLRAARAALAVAAFTSVLTNEPAEVGAGLASRALSRRTAALAGSGGRPRISFAVVLAGDVLSAVGRAIRRSCDRCSTPRSRRRA